MSTKSFSTTFSVPQSPQHVFDAIIDPRRWWSETIRGDTNKLGAVFYHQYQESHRCTLTVTEFSPSRKVVWHVLQNHFDFVKDETEWTGTDVVFEIARDGETTEVRFTHVGLSPARECYDVCSGGWNMVINGSLRALITTGKGTPDTPKEGASKPKRRATKSGRPLRETSHSRS